MRSMAIAAAVCAACLTAPALAADNAHAVLQGPNGEQVGTVTLIQSRDEGVVVQLRASGLAPGGHGFHIHRTGQCQPDFEAAGEHYAPDGRGHGYLSQDGWHAGDLPNIFADQTGAATADAFTARVSLQEAAPNTVFDQDGSAIIIHERADSYGDSAGAGGRVACGVIAPGLP